MNRSTLSADLGRREATAVAERLVGELQRGLDGRDAEVYNRSFAGDVRWGTPFGEIVVGYERLHAIHREMLPAGVGGVSRYEIVGVDAPAPGVVLAHVRRVGLEPASGPGFDEMALYVLIHRDGAWWLAAGQNTPIREKGPA